MHYFVLLAPFLAVQILAILRSEHDLQMTLVPKLRSKLKPEKPSDNLISQDDFNRDYVSAESESVNEKDTKEVEEDTPFQRFKPVGKTHDDLLKTQHKENTKYTLATESSGGRKSNITQLFEQLGQKFHQHRFMLSPAVVCLIICSTIIITCCCTIYLRNRIIACFAYCCPSKNKRDYDSVDSESGRKSKRSKFKKIKDKYSSFAISRENRPSSKDYIPIETVEKNNDIVETSPPERIIETPPSTGCCGGCKSKRKHETNK